MKRTFSVLAHFRVRHVPPGLRCLRGSMYCERCYLQLRRTVELAANSQRAEHVVNEREVPLQCRANSSFLASGFKLRPKDFLALATDLCEGRRRIAFVFEWHCGRGRLLHGALKRQVHAPGVLGQKQRFRVLRSVLPAHCWLCAGRRFSGFWPPASESGFWPPARAENEATRVACLCAPRRRLPLACLRKCPQQSEGAS